MKQMQNSVFYFFQSIYWSVYLYACFSLHCENVFVFILKSSNTCFRRKKKFLLSPSKTNLGLEIKIRKSVFDLNRSFKLSNVNHLSRGCGQKLPACHKKSDRFQWNQNHKQIFFLFKHLSFFWLMLSSKRFF